MPLLSFFTGGGFLDLGFERAGFSLAWSNDSDPAVAEMYEFAMGKLQRVRGPSAPVPISNRSCIRQLQPQQVLEEAFGSRMPKLFGVIGGPPCTDFSRGGHHRGGNGQHGRLTPVFVDLICRLRPHFFVIENVPGLCTKHRRYFNRQIVELEGKGKFATDWAILDGLELGIPQSRQRLFVVGFRKSVAKDALGRSLLPGEKDWFPWPAPKYKDARSYSWPTTSPYGGTPPRPRNVPIELTVWPLLNRQNDPRKLPNGSDYFKAYSTKFRKRSEGDVAEKSFKRLHRYRYSPTIWFGNNEVHLHPWEPRRLSVREVLRIQTVPDAYVLPEDAPLSWKFRLIGNGVPCAMAYEVATAVSEFFKAGNSR